MRFPRPLGILVCLTALLAIIGMISCAPAGARSAAVALSQPAPQLAANYGQLTEEIVHGYATPSNPSDPREYAHGIWRNGDPTCWYCNVGPAVGAAYLSPGDHSQLAVAIDTMNRAIANHRKSDGSFDGASSPAINAASFGVLLGLAYVRLEPRLDSATRRLWQRTLAGIADYLAVDGDAAWYANGNVNLSYTTELYFAWRATGQSRYLTRYNASFQFTVAPPLPRWLGFGLRVVRQPNMADGRDGRAILAEGIPPGWDPEYTQLQLDFLTTLYVASHDPRALRLLNLLLNQELTRVSQKSFTLNARGGTRKDSTLPFTSAAVAALVLSGDRPDLAGLLPAQFLRLQQAFRATLGYTQHNFYRGVALWLAPVLLATSDVPAISPPLP
jgi:hypothetical protein